MKDPNAPDLFSLSRRSDPITSKLAPAGLNVSAIQMAVLAFAKSCPDGFIDTELVDALRGTYGASTLRTRRSELVTMRLIRHRGAGFGQPAYRTVPPSGRRHIIWEAC